MGIRFWDPRAGLTPLPPNVQRRDFRHRANGESAAQSGLKPRSHSLDLSLVTWPISGARGLDHGSWKAPPGEKWKVTDGSFSSLSLPVLSLAPEETSAGEGTTRPSRGQCDAGHVIHPAVPVSSISLSPRILLMGSWGLLPPPLMSLLSLQGWANPTRGWKSSACPCPFLLPTYPLRP